MKDTGAPWLQPYWEDNDLHDIPLHEKTAAEKTAANLAVLAARPVTIATFRTFQTVPSSGGQFAITMAGWSQVLGVQAAEVTAFAVRFVVGGITNTQINIWMRLTNAGDAAAPDGTQVAGTLTVTGIPASPLVVPTFG